MLDKNDILMHDGRPSLLSLDPAQMSPVQSLYLLRFEVSDSRRAQARETVNLIVSLSGLDPSDPRVSDTIDSSLNEANVIDYHIITWN